MTDYTKYSAVQTVGMDGQSGSREEKTGATDHVDSPLRVILLISPLLLLYVAIVLTFSKNTFRGDEGGYVAFAYNLIHGYYSPRDQVDLWWGPGYPAILAPFALLRLSWLSAKLLNALLLFSANLCFYYTLRLYIDARSALVLTYVLGLYPPHLAEVHLLLTEPLAFFLIASLAYSFCRLFTSRNPSWRAILFTAAILSYLALTKVLFGYVLLAGLLTTIVFYLVNRSWQVRATFAICSLALVLCLPYLYYTRSLTGRSFYWSNSGGMQLYWMSSPYPGDLGDWHSAQEVISDSQLAGNHGEFFASISSLDGVERDDAFKATALASIRSHPIKYTENWLANVGRLLFSYPFSYTEEHLSTYFYLLSNAFVVVTSILLMYPAYRARRLIPYEIYALLAFTFIALFGSSLLSAYEREFHVLGPIIALWDFFVVRKILRIEVRHPR